jgi:cell volume regulation protein A
VWQPGLGLAVVLTLVIRPLLVGPCLSGAGLNSGERGFILFSGLKGAVPILLGTFMLSAHVEGADRLFGIVIVVVVFSVVVQGGLVPTAAAKLGVPMRTLASEPWSLGVRLQDEPNGVHRLTIAKGSAAVGRTVADLENFPGDAWISFLIRNGQLVPIARDTVLHACDETMVLADPEVGDRLAAVFEAAVSPDQPT